MIVLTSKISEAIQLASNVHSKQLRKTGNPYIMHPMAVALILSRVYPEDENLICAAILHDVVEDCTADNKVTIEDITNEFGEDVADLVKSVTEEDKSLPWITRKDLSLEKFKKMTKRQVSLKLADIIHNNVSYISFLENNDSEKLSKFSADPYEKIDQVLKSIEVLQATYPECPLNEDINEQVQVLLKYKVSVNLLSA